MPASDRTFANGESGASIRAKLNEVLAQDSYYGVLLADYVLANSTAVQKLFNWSANGALTLPTGRYHFTTGVFITAMSATTGNGNFSLAGTAIIGTPFMQEQGFDSTTPGAPAAAGQGFAAVQATTFSALMAPTGTGTALHFLAHGVFDVTTGGTVIPSIALTTAAAAIVEAGSYFRCQPLGPTGVATSSGWS